MMPHDCERVRDQLPDWSTGKLPAGEAAALAAHLGECPPCTAEARLLGALREGVPAIPSTLERRVLSAARLARPPRRTWITGRQLAVAATLVGAVIGGTLLVDMAGDGRAPPAAVPELTGVSLPGVEDPLLGGSVLPNLTEAELESLLARMES